MPPKTKLKERKMKVYYNPEMEDIPFPELMSYKLLVEKPEELKDINETEGVKLTGVESEAMNLANHDSDDLPEGATNKYLLDLAVTEIKLAAQAVTNAKIAVNAIQGDVIAASAITETKIASDAISTPKIQAGAIIAGKIATGAVTAIKIYALAVTTEKIAAGAVTSAKVTTGELITLSAQIKNAIITNAKIADLAATKITGQIVNAQIANIDYAKIYNVTIGTADIQNLAVTDAKIANLTVEKLTGTYLTGKTVRTQSSGERIEMRYYGDATYPNQLLFWGVSILKGKIFSTGANLALQGEDNSGGVIINHKSGGTLLACLSNAVVVGNPTYDQPIRPAASGAQDLGTSSYRWRYLYADRINNDILSKSITPVAHATYNLGTSGNRFAAIYGVNIYCTNQTADQHITGDLLFRYKKKIAFRISEDPDFLNFYNSKNKKIAQLDQEGNFWTKGKVRSLK